MAEFNIAETCPCGSNISVSGYTTEARAQIGTWRAVHNKHSNTIAKAIAVQKEKQTHPPFYYWPWTTTTTGADAATFTYSTGTGANVDGSTGGPEQQAGH